MIQELIGGGDVRDATLNSVTTTTANSAQNNHENQSLRCPRCDSSNTKFCYYNNYNLTQPRHFCKTCRRYWTRGGALRNVPIGGACRKNKNNYISTPIGKSNVGIHNNVAKTAIGLGLNNHHHHMFDHDHFASDYNINNPNAIWASPPNSHILALLKASQNPNPNPNRSPVGLFSDGSKMMNDSPSSGAFDELSLGLDPYSQLVPSPFWRNNQHQLQNQQQNGFNIIVGLQEMYQKIKTSNNYYATNDDHAQGVMGNFGGATTPSSSILESAPVGGSELGYNNWNSV